MCVCVCEGEKKRRREEEKERKRAEHNTPRTTFLAEAKAKVLVKIGQLR